MNTRRPSNGSCCAVLGASYLGLRDIDAHLYLLPTLPSRARVLAGRLGEHEEAHSLCKRSTNSAPPLPTYLGGAEREVMGSGPVVEETACNPVQGLIEGVTLSSTQGVTETAEDVVQAHLNLG